MRYCHLKGLTYISILFTWKYSRRLLLFLNLVVICFLIQGCFNGPNDPEQSEISQTSVTPAPETLVQSTITPIVSLLETQTPASNIEVEPTIKVDPTITKEELDIFISNLLKPNIVCLLPCYLGIIPGETQWSQTTQKLRPFIQLGSDFSTQHDAGTIHELGYQLIQDEDRTTVHLSIFQQQDAIDFITGNIISSNFNKMVDAYTLRNLLSLYGEPSRIQINLWNNHGVGDPPATIRYRMWYLYDTQGFAFAYEGGASKKGQYFRVCPSHPHHEIINANLPIYLKFNSFWFYTQSPKNSRSLDALINKAADMYVSIPMSDALSLEEAFNLKIRDLSYQIIQEKNTQPVCYDTPISLWYP